MATFVELERNHYDTKSQGLRDEIANLRSSYQRLESGYMRAGYRAWLKSFEFLKGKQGTILDVGTGFGYHAIRLQQTYPAATICGIDVSMRSLEVARRFAEQALDDRVPTFIPTDVHALNFDNNSFDAVADYESFSSFDFFPAIREIHRVLKPGGRLVAFETFGHNPLINCKRYLNKLRKKRTSWAVNNIMRQDKLRVLPEIFSKVDLRYFGLFTLAHSPFQPSRFLNSLEAIDDRLAQVPFFQKGCFKVLIEAKK